MMWIEHMTSPLPRECSATELHGLLLLELLTTNEQRKTNQTVASPVALRPVSSGHAALAKTTGACPNETGAGEGNRTLVISLEGFCSTIELHPLFPRFLLQILFYCLLLLPTASLPIHPGFHPVFTQNQGKNTRKLGGGGWIRTIVLVRGQIYSLLPLTTRPPHPTERTSNYEEIRDAGQVQSHILFSALSEGCEK